MRAETDMSKSVALEEDAELADELRSYYLSTAAERLRTLDDHLAAVRAAPADAQAVARLREVIHKFSGSAGTYGFSDLSRAAKDLETRLTNAAGEPTVEIHPDDAERRQLCAGQRVRVFNDRGEFQARAVIAESVKPGVVVTQGIWWNRFTPDGVNCNVTTSTRLTDFGSAATFFDNLVEVAGLKE